MKRSQSESADFKIKDTVNVVVGLLHGREAVAGKGWPPSAGCPGSPCPMHGSGAVTYWGCSMWVQGPDGGTQQRPELASMGHDSTLAAPPGPALASHPHFLVQVVLWETRVSEEEIKPLQRRVSPSGEWLFEDMGSSCSLCRWVPQDSPIARVAHAT